MQITESFIKYLRNYLLVKRMSISDFSKESHITQPAISNWLSGKSYNQGIQAKTIERLCRIFNITPSQLYQISTGENPYKEIEKVSTDPIEHFAEWMKYNCSKEAQEKIILLAKNLYGYKESHKVSYPFEQ